jgi:hypothetical protein
VEVLKVLGFFHNLLIVACITITPCPLLDFLQISSMNFLKKNLCMYVFGYVPLIVDLDIRVIIVGNCD